MGIKLQPATRDDVTEVAANLRQSDIVELKAMYGDNVDVGTALYLSYARSENCQAAYLNGKPIALFGFVKMVHRPGVLIPWLLCTEELKLHVKTHIRETRRAVKDALKDAHYLFNFVHAENEASIKFLEAVGFTIHPAEPHGRQGALFHMFDMGDVEVYMNSPVCGTLLTSTSKEPTHVH